MIDKGTLVVLLTLSLCSLACYGAWARLGGRLARWVTGALLILSLGDGLLLGMLPRLGFSFGHVIVPWLAMILIRAVLACGAAFAWRNVSANRLPRNIGVWFALNAAILACEIYGLYVEPFNLGVTPLNISGNFAPVRIVHLSDIHIERTTRRERAVLETVARLEPDLILLTGDYLNCMYTDDAIAYQDARDFLSQLRAKHGVYAISGSLIVDTENAIQALFSDMGNITLLDDEVAQLTVAGQSIYLIGVANREPGRDGASLQRLMAGVPPEAFSILLYHTPDLIEIAAAAGVDLYLAGHTHGGQIRLPWYGAIVTFSSFGKRYESGLHQLGATQMYVSRGIGMDGYGLPRARFFCPPEIVELMLGSQ